jgi:hypothetical protein
VVAVERFSVIIGLSVSLLGWRSTKILIGMAVTAVILIGAAVQLMRMGDQHESQVSNGGRFYIEGSICFGIAAALLIAIVAMVVVALVRLRRPPER